MKKNLSLLLPVILSAVILVTAGFGGGDLKYSTGAPPGYTNSPADGLNCSHCMGGTATPVTGWITSNIPASGFVLGQTYTFAISAAGTTKKGCEISPQDPGGNLVGSMNPLGNTKLVGLGKYLTHTTSSAANPTIWTFEWTAPVVETGDVVFYASIALGKTNTQVTTYTVSQNTLGLKDQEARILSVYPNPARDRFSLAFFLPAAETCKAELLAVSGKTDAVLLSEALPAGNHTKVLSTGLPAGIYLLRFRAGNSELSRKIIIE